MDFVSQDYWDHSYRDYQYGVANDELTSWIEAYEPFIRPAGTLFEFGCYPGRYLSFLGKKGWVVSGMDLTPGIGQPAFANWLRAEGIKTDLLRQGDALAYAASTPDRYNLVCSFGFVEHFEDYLRVIDLHDRILAPGGWLLISTPNFRGGVQKLLHQSLNPESLKIHYLPSMQPGIWESGLRQKGYAVKYAGYFGGFDFWHNYEERNFLKSTALKVIHKVKPFLKHLPNRSLYSPYCGIVAQKPQP